MTLDEWANECWGLLQLRQYVRVDYQGKYRRHIKPYFGHIDITAIKKRDVQRWLNGLTPALGSHVLTVFQALMKQACDPEDEEAPLHGRPNPTRGLNRKQHKPQSKDWLVPAEIFALADKGAFGNYKDLVLLLLTTGLRWSEYHSLTPEDIDEGRRIINVTKGAKGDAPKRRASYRKVPYQGYFSPNGMPRSYKWALMSFRSATCTVEGCKHLRRGGCNGLSIHSLRYSYAWTLAHNNVPPTVAKELMGHEEIETTLGIYTKVLTQDRDDATRALDDYFARLIKKDDPEE